MELTAWCIEITLILGTHVGVTKAADFLEELQLAEYTGKMRKAFRLLPYCPPPSKGKTQTDGLDLGKPINQAWSLYDIIYLFIVAFYFFLYSRFHLYGTTLHRYNLSIRPMRFCGSFWPQTFFLHFTIMLPFPFGAWYSAWEKKSPENGAMNFCFNHRRCDSQKSYR